MKTVPAKHFHHPASPTASGKMRRQLNKRENLPTTQTADYVNSIFFFYVLKKHKKNNKKIQPNILLCLLPMKKTPALPEKRAELSRVGERGEKRVRERESGRETRRGRNTTYLLLLQMQQLDCAYFAARVTSA